MNPNERHIIDELKKAATPLPPDDYFTQLKNDLLAGTVTVKIVPLYRRRWMIVSAAASVILVVAFLVRNGQPAGSATGAPDWNSVSREEVLAYIDDNIDDFETETIAAQLDSLPDWRASAADTSVIAQTGSADEKYDKLFDGVEKEDILEYLQEEDDEVYDELLIGS
jgi:hypothetical protein